jgi:hypothetical protein
MKVKELKSLLEGCDENLNVLIGDAADGFIQITGGGERTEYALILWCRQEFPDEWFDPKSQQERKWINGKPVVLNPESMKYEFCMYIDGNDRNVELQLYDGYGEGHGIKVKYPMLEELTDEQIEQMDIELGGRISTSGYVALEDVCCCFAEIDKDTAPPEEPKKGVKHFKNFSVVHYKADEDKTPFDATEVFVYREDKPMHDTLCELLEEMGFDYMDAYPDEGTEFNGHVCSYWAKCEAQNEP